MKPSTPKTERPPSTQLWSADLPPAWEKSAKWEMMENKGKKMTIKKKTLLTPALAHHLKIKGGKMKEVLLLFFTLTFPAFAQITVTTSDISNQYTIGNSVQLNSDPVRTTIDIGTTGGGNNWDFSMLQDDPQVQNTVYVVNPSSTPFTGDFPAANIATHLEQFGPGVEADQYSYFILDPNFKWIGLVFGNASIVNKTFFDPYDLQLQLPLTFNSAWVKTNLQTGYTYWNGNLTSSSTSAVDEAVIVDAYGAMILPGGFTYDALRIRRETTRTTSPNPTVSYTFFAKNGASVMIRPAGIQPNNGIINIEWIGWNTELPRNVDFAPPIITALSSGNNLTLLWPATATGYRVESTLSLSPPTSWSNVTGTFQTNGGFISMVLPTPRPQNFYRLVKP